MTELLFGLTVLFLGYVLFEVFKTVSSGTGNDEATHLAPPAAQPPKPAAAPAPKAEPAAAAAPAPVKEVKAPAPAPAAKPAPATAAPAATADAKTQNLLNPATGERSPVPTNYRFAKKWIKDALVSEGLLDRVYKNSELNGANGKKVKDALDKLRELPKYQG